MGDGLPLLTWRDKKRPRPYREPRQAKPKEHTIQISVTTGILDRFMRKGWRYFHPANGEKREAKDGAKLKAMGVKRGVPDLILVSPTGLVHFLEFKRHPTESLKDEQLDWQQWAIERGIPHRVAWSVDMAWTAFEDWKCVTVDRNGRRMVP